MRNWVRKHVFTLCMRSVHTHTIYLTLHTEVPAKITFLSCPEVVQKRIDNPFILKCLVFSVCSGHVNHFCSVTVGAKPISCPGAHNCQEGSTHLWKNARKGQNLKLKYNGSCQKTIQLSIYKLVQKVPGTVLIWKLNCYD